MHSRRARTGPARHDPARRAQKLPQRPVRSGSRRVPLRGCRLPALQHLPHPARGTAAARADKGSDDDPAEVSQTPRPPAEKPLSTAVSPPLCTARGAPSPAPRPSLLRWRRRQEAPPPRARRILGVVVPGRSPHPPAGRSGRGRPTSRPRAETDWGDPRGCGAVVGFVRSTQPALREVSFEGRFRTSRLSQTDVSKQQSETQVSGCPPGGLAFPQRRPRLKAGPPFRPAPAAPPPQPACFRAVRSLIGRGVATRPRIGCAQRRAESLGRRAQLDEDGCRRRSRGRRGAVAVLASQPRRVPAPPRGAEEPEPCRS